ATGGLEIDSKLDNSGKLLAEHGALFVNADITGSGLVQIDNDAMLELNGKDAGTVTFGAGAKGTLKLDAPNQFTGTIDGLDIGDTIELNTGALQTQYGSSIVSHTEIGSNELTVTLKNGAQITYDIGGNLSGNTFVIRDLPDGHVGLTLKESSGQVDTNVPGA